MIPDSSTMKHVLWWINSTLKAQMEMSWTCHGHVLWTMNFSLETNEDWMDFNLKLLIFHILWPLALINVQHRTISQKVGTLQTKITINYENNHKIFDALWKHIDNDKFYYCHNELIQSDNFKLNWAMSVYIASFQNFKNVQHKQTNCWKFKKLLLFSNCMTFYWL